MYLSTFKRYCQQHCMCLLYCTVLYMHFIVQVQVNSSAGAPPMRFHRPLLSWSRPPQRPLHPASASSTRNWTRKSRLLANTSLSGGTNTRTSISSCLVSHTAAGGFLERPAGRAGPVGSPAEEWRCRIAARRASRHRAAPCDRNHR